jgi:hypothetical protein
MTTTIIRLSMEHVAEGLRLERERARALDVLHVTENDLARYMAHLAGLYAAPEGAVIRNWLTGFETMEDSNGERDS